MTKEFHMMVLDNDHIEFRGDDDIYDVPAFDIIKNFHIYWFAADLTKKIEDAYSTNKDWFQKYKK